MALKSSEEERALLRARSALQRFPVVEWRQRTEDFHKRSITISRTIAGSKAWRESDCDGAGSRPMQDTDDWNPVDQAQPTQPNWDARSMASSVYDPNAGGQWSQEHLPNAGHPQTPGTPSGSNDQQGFGNFLERANRAIGKDQRHAPDPFLEGGLGPNRPFGSHSRVSSVESISSIVDEKSNSPLNKAIASVRFHDIIFLDNWLI